MTGKLTVSADGRVTGPANIRYNEPFPCVNGAFETGAMMGVVMHTMAGNLPGTIGVFNDPARQASAHFGIAQDGEIWQFGPIGKGWAAWHAVAANRAWYGIEHADDGNPRNPLTAAQITASAQLVELLSRFAGFPLQVTDSPSVKGYGTHVMGGPAWNPDGHTCPGPGPRAGQRPKIIALAMSIRQGGTVTQPRQWITAGMSSLATLAGDQKTTAAVILQLTAQHSPSPLPAELAVYLNGVFSGTVDPAKPVPRGLTLYLPG
jgi:hypothetical protein